MTVDTWEKLMTGISETVNTNNSVWPPRYLMSAHKIFSTFLTRPVREYSLRPGQNTIWNCPSRDVREQDLEFGKSCKIIIYVLQQNCKRSIFSSDLRQDEFIGSVNLEEAARYQEIRWHATLANEELNPSDPFSCKHITLPSPYMLHVTCHTC